MKSWSKRVISAVLVIAMLVTLCPYVAQRMTVEAEERPAGAASTTADGKHVTRGVVDKITELPQYRENIEEYLENEKKYYRTDDIDIRGEVDERPFVVLEIVPDECYAEFGYQISGCEPVDMSNLYGHGDVVNRVAGLVNAETHQYTAYFFPDEPEGKEKNYADGKLKVYDTGSEIQLYGYYEIVEDGTGTFEAKGTGDDITFVKGGKKLLSGIP
ncbi:MAG: hypothetical protein PUF65_03210 [Lachnospiraceae bacterium]|nr:hypothetical protein [Lachnospiraceae bacterium]